MEQMGFVPVIGAFAIVGVLATLAVILLRRMAQGNNRLVQRLVIEHELLRLAFELDRDIVHLHMTVDPELQLLRQMPRLREAYLELKSAYEEEERLIYASVFSKIRELHARAVELGDHSLLDRTADEHFEGCPMLRNALDIINQSND